MPAFPAITYDLTIMRTHASPIHDTVARIRTSHPLLEDVVLHDLYDGKPLQAGHFNATLRCTYRAHDRTLTEDEAKAAHAEVMKLAGAAS